MERAELIRWILANAPARAGGDFVFLQDPHASTEDRTGLDHLCELAPRVAAENGWLCIPTGGSSGRSRFARHDEETLKAAVSGFCLHFAVAKINAVGVLPLHHVSGLMGRVRSLMTQGEFIAWDWKALAAGQWPDLNPRAEGWFLSLVPTQLQHLLQTDSGAEFLRRFRLVFIGGGPAWPELLDRAATAQIPLSFSYGMTETAAMIAAQATGAFMAGERNSGHIMPHAQVTILDEQGRPCAPGQAGQITVKGRSLFRGYFPEARQGDVFAPDDLGSLDAENRLTVLGRSDGMIISGGEKIWPAEVEASLRATHLFSDVAVLGIPDTTWGSAVAAFYPAEDGARRIEEVSAALVGQLAPYKIPKHLIAVQPWPRSPQGKISRETLLKRVKP